MKIENLKKSFRLFVDCTIADNKDSVYSAVEMYNECVKRGLQCSESGVRRYLMSHHASFRFCNTRFYGAEEAIEKAERIKKEGYRNEEGE